MREKERRESEGVGKKGGEDEGKRERTRRGRDIEKVVRETKGGKGERKKR